MNTDIHDVTISKANISDLFTINQLLKFENLPEVNPEEFTEYFYKAINKENNTNTLSHNPGLIC